MMVSPAATKIKTKRLQRTLSASEKAQALAEGIRVLAVEARAIHQLSQQLDTRFTEACELMLRCQGHVIVMGMGKSGQIGKKIAATLASTGTPAFFVHPGEAAHGDLGMVMTQDTMLLLSYSGETHEIISLLPRFRRQGIRAIAITNAPESTLARFADVHLSIAVREEACPLGLAPTTSTTTTLALGDALAIALTRLRGFSTEDFAFSHPGGQLGRRLLIRVSDVMLQGQDLPRVFPDQTLASALLEMTRARLGMTVIVPHTDPDQLLGIFTDGDLRRTLQSGLDIHNTVMSQLMIPAHHTIQPDQLASDALRLMDTHRINTLPVLNPQGRLVGALNLHTLLVAKVL